MAVTPRLWPDRTRSHVVVRHETHGRPDACRWLAIDKRSRGRTSVFRACAEQPQGLLLGGGSSAIWLRRCRWPIATEGVPGGALAARLRFAGSLRGATARIDERISVRWASQPSRLRKSGGVRGWSAEVVPCFP
jgi:hypothetical protein